jgi:FKBP-type peptidyl-prolyl cis-trans isomerase
MRSLRVAIVGGLFGLAAGGCGEPGPISPMAPPGANIPRPSPDAEPAQAVGESAPMPDAPKPTVANASKYKPALPTAKGETKTTPGGVKYETLKEGSGPELKLGEQSELHYVGTLEKGGVVDSSRERNEPFKTRIGVDPLIEGWVEGIPGMKVGEIRKLTIPSALGYKSEGRLPKIPPDSKLVFEVELLSIIP